MRHWAHHLRHEVPRLASRSRRTGLCCLSQPGPRRVSVDPAAEMVYSTSVAICLKKLYMNTNLISVFVWNCSLEWEVCCDFNNLWGGGNDSFNNFWCFGPNDVLHLLHIAQSSWETFVHTCPYHTSVLKLLTMLWFDPHGDWGWSYHSWFSPVELACLWSFTLLMEHHQPWCATRLFIHPQLHLYLIKDSTHILMLFRLPKRRLWVF